MNKSILFVDDETNILQGLKRMLRSLRHEMDFSFVESGDEALTFLSDNEVSVIVSDMRMPGMDGAALLQTVLEKHPHIIRIMLTGHADDQSILKTIPVVHQFLAKPSDPQTLKEVLKRACALQEIISSDRLKTIVASLGTLPSLPDVYAELQEVLKDPECSIQEVGRIIEKDLAMSAKILQLVNSAFFGLYNSVDSPGRAVSLLGLDTVKALVLGVGVFTELAPTQSSLSVSQLWDHSFTVASFAREIAKIESDDKVEWDNSFIAGIVHDIGKLLFLSCMADEYESIVETVKTEKLEIFKAEQRIFEADHGDVGGYLIGLWGLPGNVVEAITFHHKLDSYPEESFCPAIAVHAANVIYYKLFPDMCLGAVPTLNVNYLLSAGLEGRFEIWVERCQELLSEGNEDD